MWPPGGVKHPPSLALISPRPVLPLVAVVYLALISRTFCGCSQSRPILALISPILCGCSSPRPNLAITSPTPLWLRRISPKSRPNLACVSRACCGCGESRPYLAWALCTRRGLSFEPPHAQTTDARLHCALLVQCEIVDCCHHNSFQVPQWQMCLARLRPCAMAVGKQYQLACRWP